MIRICPKPKPWDNAYNRLTNFAKKHDCRPPLPPRLLILNGWVFSNDFEKRNRWEETVEWAESNGCLCLVDRIPDSDFYFVGELSSYAEGTVYRSWNTESKKRPSSGVLEKSMETLVQQWPKIAGEELSNITQPIKFTGKKARRLLVKADTTSQPPWGGWTYLSKVESERRAFTKFRALVNQAILPHEVDHIDFLADEIAERDSTMKKAHCHSQEYWYLRKQKCECGSELQLIDQALTERNQTHVDVHRTQCKQCGKSREFVFDISSFYNPLRSFDELAEVEQLLKRVYPESEVPMRMAYPMEATLWYIEQLKKSNDIMALEYIAEVVQDAIRNTNTGHTEIHWEFTPYNLDEWNNAEERVLFVGPEPNGDNPHREILDMGQWFRMACEENGYLGNRRFFKRCEIMLNGLGVKYDAFRFMDLKAVGGGAQAQLSVVRKYVINNLDQVCKYFTSTNRGFGLAPHIIILLGGIAQPVFDKYVRNKVFDSGLKWVGMPSPSSRASYEGLKYASANIRQHLKPITEQAEKWVYHQDDFDDWRDID